MDATPSANELLGAFLSDPEEAVVGYRLDGTIFLWNRAAETLYGYKAVEVTEKSVKCLLPLYELHGIETLLSDPVRGIHKVGAQQERLRKDGVLLAVHVSHSLLRTPQGDLLGIVERARDSALEMVRAAAAAHLNFLVEKLPLYFWTTDRRLHITSYWGSTSARGGAFPSDSLGQPIQQFFRIEEASESPVKQHFLAIRGIASRVEFATSERRYDLSVEPYRTAQGNIIGCIGMALDITEQRKSEDEIRYRATHDGLTGLANYREFVDSLEREVRRADRTCQPFALLLLDLDDLKTINDRFGHLRGNQALQRLAGIMREHCRATEIAARFGGDEFAILLLDADAALAQTVAERIRTCLASHPDPPMLSVSIGLSVFPGDGPTASDLLEAADKRLYQDKKTRATRTTPRVEQSR